MSAEDRDEIAHRVAHARLRLPRPRYVLVELAGGEPLSAVICPSEALARQVAAAKGLQTADFRIVQAEEL